VPVVTAVPDNSEDMAEWQVYSYIEVDCIDNIAPTISLTPSRLLVQQETTVSELETLLAQGVTLQDDYSTVNQISLSHGTLTQQELNTPGDYLISYTATDAVGNSRMTQRFIRVYSKDELQVQINGQKTETATHLFADTDSINLSVPICRLALANHTKYT
jgi:hypothetical protein